MQAARRGQSKARLKNRTAVTLRSRAYGYLLDQRRRRKLLAPTVLACLFAAVVVAGILSRPAISATVPGAVEPTAEQRDAGDVDTPDSNEPLVDGVGSGEGAPEEPCEEPDASVSTEDGLAYEADAESANAEIVGAAVSDGGASDEIISEFSIDEEATFQAAEAEATASGQVYYGVDTRQFGMTINLFDYSGNGTNGSGDVLEGPSSRAGSPLLVGINNPTSVENPSLDLASVLYFSRHTTFDENSSYITSHRYRDLSQGAAVNQGIVGDTLGSDLYPYLSTASGAGGSLAYLFNESPITDASTAASYKTVYQNVTGLFTFDEGGYLVYDSNQTYARLYQSYESGYIFGLYDTYADSTSTEKKPRQIGFFPFDDPVFDGTDTYTDKDHFFGMTMTADFLVPPGGQVNGQDMVFEFSGDDDMWVFIDNVLMLDMGGIHARRSGSINFATGEIKTDSVYQATDATGNPLGNAMNSANDPTHESAAVPVDLATRYNSFWNEGELGAWTDNYSRHQIRIFYLERGSGESNLMIKTNLVFPYTDVTARKVWSDGAAKHNADSVQVGLFRRDQTGNLLPFPSKEDQLTTTLNAASNWTATFENVQMAEIPTQYNVAAERYDFVVKELSYTSGGTTYNLYGVGSDGYGKATAAQGPYVASEAMFGDALARTLTGAITNTAIRKVDDDGKPLANAHLYLHAATYNAKTGAVSWDASYMENITSDANGYLKLPSLAAGDYVLWEFNSPDGYSRSRPGSTRLAWLLHVGETEAATASDSTVNLTVTTLKDVVIAQPGNKDDDPFSGGTGVVDAEDSYFLTAADGSFSLINRMRPKLLVNKVDSKGHALNGVTFTITPMDENWDPVTDDPNRLGSTRTTGSTDKNVSGFDGDTYKLTGKYEENGSEQALTLERDGSVRFLDVYEGNYLLEEVSASGYATSGPWRVVVKGGRVTNVYAQNPAGEWVHPNDSSITDKHTYIRTRSTYKTSNNQTVYYGSVIYLRNYENEVSIKKVAANGPSASAALANVTFALYTVGTNPQQVNGINGKPLRATTDSNGIVRFSGIPTTSGTTSYYLYEVTAATGYRLPDEPWLLEVDADGTTRLYDRAKTSAVQADGDGRYVLSNYVDYQLPKAGGGGAAPFVATGASMVAAAAFGLLCRRRRRPRGVGWSPPG